MAAAGNSFTVAVKETTTTLTQGKNVNHIVLSQVGLAEVWIFTARIRRMGKVIFSVCSHLPGGGGGYPVSGLRWGRGVHQPGLGGYPISGPEGVPGVPPPQT